MIPSLVGFFQCFSAHVLNFGLVAFLWDDFCNIPLPAIERDMERMGLRSWHSQMSQEFLVLCSEVLHPSSLQFFRTGRAEILCLELLKE